MSVRELLPGSIGVSDDGTLFELSIDGTSFGRSLASLCPACAVFDGATVPKPAFTATFGDTVSLPEDVVGAVIESGSVTVRITNDLNFDPIRTGGGESGVIRVSVLSGGEVLATDAVDGAVESFPDGAERDLMLAFESSAVSRDIAVELTVESPAGDPVTVDANGSLDIVVTPGVLGIAEAEIELQADTVSFQPMGVDLTGLEDTAIDRIRHGAFRLRIHNPMAVEGDIDLRIETNAAVIERSILVGQGDATQRIEITGEELRSVAGQDATFSASGIISAPTGTVTLTPDQVLVIDGELELVLGPRED